MARAKLARPTFLVEAPGAIEARDGFIRLDLGGLDLALTPHAANYIGHHLNAAILDFYQQQRELAPVVKFPRSAPVIRCVGEAC